MKSVQVADLFGVGHRPQVSTPTPIGEANRLRVAFLSLPRGTSAFKPRSHFTKKLQHSPKPALRFCCLKTSPAPDVYPWIHIELGIKIIDLEAQEQRLKGIAAHAGNLDLLGFSTGALSPRHPRILDALHSSGPKRSRSPKPKAPEVLRLPIFEIRPKLDADAAWILSDCRGPKP